MARKERVLWRSCLVLALLSPLAVYGLWTGTLTSQEFPTIALVLGPVLVGLVIEVLLNLALGQPVRFMIERPTVGVRHLVAGDPASISSAVAARMNELGFSVSSSPQGLEAQKGKARRVHQVLDNAFSARARIEQQEAGVAVAVEVTLHDTLLIDSGEDVQLTSIGNFLALQADELRMAHTPLLVLNTVGVAAVLVLLGLLALAGRPLSSHLLGLGSFIGVGLAIWSLALIARSSGGLVGTRVALLAGALNALAGIGLLLRSTLG